MFDKGIKIGEGEKYDLTKVSTEGISQEEAAKKNAKLIDIFNAIDTNKDGKLSSAELAQAMDLFGDYDADGNGKLSKKELKALADDFNEALGKNGKEKLKGSNFKDFIKNIVSATKGDPTAEVQTVLEQQKKQQEAIAHRQKIEKLDAEAKKLGYEPTNNEGVYYSKDKNAYVLYDEESKTFKPAKYDNEKKTFEFKTEEEIKADETAAAEAKKAAEEAAAAEERKKQEAEAPKSHKYTVQADETFTEVIKKSLKAQGIENPTTEQIEAAKEQFKKDNPGAVKKTKSGYEYLLVGAEVNLPGKVESPKSKAEAEAEWAQKHPDLVAGGGGTNPVAKKGKANGDLTAEEKKTADAAAQKAGYRHTDCAGIYYDEANKQHYKFNTATGKLEKFDAHQVWADGSYSYRYKGDERAQGDVRNVYDKNGNKIQQEWTRKSDGAKILNEYKDGKRVSCTETYTDGSSSVYLDYDSNQEPTKRINRDKDGNIISIITFENKKDGSYKAQEVDAQGKPIGEPTYYDKDDNEMPKEEYEKRQ